MANPSRRGYTAYNKSVLMKGLTIYAKNAIKPEVQHALIQVANKVVADIDSGGRIPEYTSNLHDSTGVAVYADGAVVSFIPTKKATKKAKSGLGGVNHYGIDGREFLVNTINEAASTFAKGIWFVVFSTVPYAYHIETVGSPIGRGQGFFKKTYQEAVNEILAGLAPIAESVSVSAGTSL